MRFTYILLVLLLCASCKKDDDKVDPCEKETPLTAGFEMREVTLDPRYAYFQHKSTNVCLGGSIYFKALEEGAEYTWQVGDEPNTRNGKDFTISFSDYAVQNGAPIKVTLTVKKKRNSCFPEDDTVKTTTQILSFSKESFIDGKFLGKFEHESQQRIIEIYTNRKVIDVASQDSVRGVMIIGIPEMDTISISQGFIRSMWEAGFDFNIYNPYATEEIKGIVRGSFTLNDDKKTVTGSYQRYVGAIGVPENLVEYKFTGQLIQ